MSAEPGCLQRFVRRGTLLALAIQVIAATTPMHAETRITLGTIAPKGTAWHDVLLQTRQQWKEISNGEVELRIYAGGVLGGEEEMIESLLRTDLDAVAISGAGLSRIDAAADCLQLPLLFSSSEDLERIKDAVFADVERSFESRGYKILNWMEVGWLHVFAREPVRTSDDLRRLRLWIPAESPAHQRMFQELGFRVVLLPAADMLAGLQAGRIDAIHMPPLFALVDRSYQEARYMTGLEFAPLNAATLIRVEAWERIPKAYRKRLLVAAQTAADAYREDIRRSEKEAIDEMSARGLTVVKLDSATIAEWRTTARSIYRDLACSREHSALFDKIMALTETPSDETSSDTKGDGAPPN